ncbi:response regulator containing a CheY-like receiver domain and a GGDEF domain [Leptolyngbyaceae cyanobacterium JSC-12]|nr:response regulator containing a CheY-like receiver domain and a GGDEF domain [Leptolyngbyaceae cyanobacterium JSC-12]
MRYFELLGDLEQLQFSGQLTLTSLSGYYWNFYLFEGQITYVSGGVHPVRRWRRNLAIYCPLIPNHRVGWQSHLANCDPEILEVGWEYALLNLWVAQCTITCKQAAQMIYASVIEVLFDIAQAVDVTEPIRQENILSDQLGAISVTDAIAEAERRWQIWQNAKLAHYSPNQAPILRQPEQLRKHSSIQSYQNLVELLNGQNTLHELAIQMQRNVVEVAVSLQPFVRVGWVDFVQTPDYYAPIYQSNAFQGNQPILKQGKAVFQRAMSQRIEVASAVSVSPEAITSRKALIACIDDSSLVLNMMEQLLTSAGYQFIGVEDGLRAIAAMLTHKPDLIFLDLVMPNTNGYEICEELRKISCFRTTPIVMLTGNDRYVNRLRSSFAGASEFLSKPLDAGAVLSVLHKHLNCVNT